MPSLENTEFARLHISWFLLNGVLMSFSLSTKVIVFKDKDPKPKAKIG